jgi:SET domain-containing protein
MNEPASRFEPWKALFCAETRVQLGKSNPKELSSKDRRKAIPENRTVNKARIKRILSQPNGLHKLLCLNINQDKFPFIFQSVFCDS